jgi:hypothetical protein
MDTEITDLDSQSFIHKHQHQTSSHQKYIEIAQLIVFFFSFLFLLNLYILYVDTEKIFNLYSFRSQMINNE